MKACTALPWSSAISAQQKYWCTSWKQTKRCSSTNPAERRRNNASPIISESAPPSLGYDVDPDSKTVATAVGQLPLSPIMDPAYWDATTRHQTPKATKGKAKNSVERQFRKNPFAKALATPVRYCSASKIRLPTFFLQDFNLISHPETGRPWWVPRSLAWDEPSESQEADATSNEQADRESERAESAIPGETAGAEAPVTDQPDHTKPYGPSAYLLARQDLISALSSTKPSGYERHSTRLFGGSSSRYASLSRKAIWRQDMDSLVLDRMRGKIVKDLLYLSRLCTQDSRHYIVKCYGWDDVQYKHQGAVLWLGVPSESDEAKESEVQPGPFATYDISKGGPTTTVAVHNMPMLLGNTATAEIREKSAIFGDGFLFMLAGRRTTDLQSELWRLQGYLADYTESP